MAQETWDVIVVGSGNAGLSAAASAAQHLGSGARIVVLEKAPREWAGGNSTFTAGAYRTVFHGLDDVLPLVTNVSDSQAERIDMQPYLEEDFMRDLKRMTGGRTNPKLADVLVGKSRETTRWLRQECGIRFVLSFHRQAYEVEGRQKFWGGMVLAVEDGGKGLINMHLENVARLGVEVRYDTAVTDLLTSGKKVTGVQVTAKDGSTRDLLARGGVVLAAGGFESNADLRRQHLGPGWERAYVRATPHNTGDLLQLLTQRPESPIQAVATGDWAGCHSTCWDFNAPRDRGDLALTNQFTKSGYPLGIMVNALGQRFVDEGEDMRNFTYAKFGRAILAEPDGVAFQVWDADGAKWLRKEEYAPDVVEHITAGSIEELAEALAGKGLRDTAAFQRTLEKYNAAVSRFQTQSPEVKFDPSKKDGLSTVTSDLPADEAPSPPKTNWALPISKAPFLAVKVTCGVTFTFGGVQTDAETAGVVDRVTQKPVPGLFVAGEMVGDLFHGNYPGGSGLTSGAVFGRLAGKGAAQRVEGKA